MALAKSEGEELSDGAFKEVSLPDNEVEGARRLGELFDQDIVFIENSVRGKLDFEGVTIPQLPNTIFIAASTNDPILQVAAHELAHTIRRTKLGQFIKAMRIRVLATGWEIS